ncbi:hypothetical protein FEM48_Zijuj08G0149900 [Ziziphus jujuba var. spinosa]|uniref:Protein MIZU-KUSSEI 1-like n=1 Tax=Ziziphus jujuba var. spinosa TaxID=714518 RepID=A0A978UZS9_ZIZJJ|nr:hypothetical protein FEM48_Zijuj08G0149900 [Ziziphus jujuba var. spinosa]
MAYPTTVGTTTITNGVTVVDCQKQVRSWRLLRSLMELLIPSCTNCTTFIDEQQDDHHHHQQTKQSHNNPYQPCFSTSNIVTGTIFGYRKGKVSFCIQTTSKSTKPILLLELAIPTTVLAREMQAGFLRIALECATPGYGYSECGNSYSLLSMPVWTMYCNGRNVGYAAKRRPSKPDLDALRLMGSVVAGAGIINGKELDRPEDDELMYLRANFERVYGSKNSESFHLIDPEGTCMGQELSIFFYRPR